MSRDTKIVNISGVVKPTRRMRAIATALHGPGHIARLGSMLNDASKVNEVASTLDRALEAATARDGRVDLRAGAISIIREMRANQRPTIMTPLQSATLVAMSESDAAVRQMAGMFDRALVAGTKGANIDLQVAALTMIHEMRRSQK